jgi:hypothetical protein
MADPGRCRHSSQAGPGPWRLGETAACRPRPRPIFRQRGSVAVGLAIRPSSTRSVSASSRSYWVCECTFGVTRHTASDAFQLSAVAMATTASSASGCGRALRDRARRTTAISTGIQGPGHQCSRTRRRGPRVLLHQRTREHPARMGGHRHRRHDSLFDPGLHAARMTPAQMFSHGIARAGYIEVPRDPQLAYEFLKVEPRTIQPKGVK